MKAGRTDSVATIARRYGVSAEQVAQWNDVARLLGGMPHLMVTGGVAVNRVHVLDNGVAELGALHFACSIHQAGEIVGHRPGPDRLVHRRQEQVGGLGPAHVAEHHLAGENDRTRVDLVEVGVFRGGAVSCFEDGVTRHIVDVRARSDTDTTHLCGERIGEVVTVQIHRCDDIIIARTDDRELQRNICNRVFDEEHLLPLAAAVRIP